MNTQVYDVRTQPALYPTLRGTPLKIEVEITGNLIKGMIAEQQLSCKDFADKAGVRLRAVQSWTDGKFFPMYSKVKRILDALNTSTQEFFGARDVDSDVIDKANEVLKLRLKNATNADVQSVDHINGAYDNDLHEPEAEPVSTADLAALQNDYDAQVVAEVKLENSVSRMQAELNVLTRQLTEVRQQKSQLWAKITQGGKS
jgi:transcriptional regulator with XRE-family HTH domain